MQDPVVLRFRGLPPNPNVRRHWAKQHTDNQEWKRLAWVLAKDAKGPLLERAAIHYHISVGDNRRHDADNIIASLKPVQDGLIGILIKDDGIDNITVTYSFDREKPRGFTITLEQV